MNIIRYSHNLIVNFPGFDSEYEMFFVPLWLGLKLQWLLALNQFFFVCTLRLRFFSRIF